MTNEMLESNMRDVGLYLLMFFSTTAGVALSVFLLRQFTSFATTSPPDPFDEAAAFANIMGGLFLFMEKETILAFRILRRVWFVVLEGFLCAVAITSVRYVLEAMFPA